MSRKGLLSCGLLFAVFLSAHALYAAKPEGAGNPGVNPNAAFETVEIFVVVAKRSAVANDEGTKAVHLEGIAQAQRNGDTLDISEHGDDDGDGFIDLVQNNPGNSSNTNVPQGHLRITQLVLVDNNFEGEGVVVFDLDGDGPAPQDEDGDGTPDDANGDGVDDDDQVVPVRVRVGHRANASGDFLQGTLHNSLDDAGSIEGEPAESIDQPRVNGRIRSGRS